MTPSPDGITLALIVIGLIVATLGLEAELERRK